MSFGILDYVLSYQKAAYYAFEQICSNDIFSFKYIVSGLLSLYYIGFICYNAPCNQNRLQFHTIISKPYHLFQKGNIMAAFIEFLKAIVFGIVEGITEWLPISSTGHMIILEEFFSISKTQGDTFYNFFIVIIQLGAIFAVIVNFFSQLWPFGKKKSHEEKREIWNTWLKIFVASIPAGVIGILFDDWFEEKLYGYLTVSITLMAYGVVFLVIEYLLKRKARAIKQRYHLNRESDTVLDEEKKKDYGNYSNYPIFNITSIHSISIQYALIIGLAQVLALIPGTSRSGVTICAALLLSIDRKTAAQFSFFMSVPAMLGGSLVKSIKFVASGTHITGMQVGLTIVGMVVAFAVSLFVIKFFMKMLRTKTFTAFGVYRIALGIVLISIYYGLLKDNPDYMVSLFHSVLPCISSGYLTI